MSEHDDLASAALDGALTPDERARVADDAEVRSRMETFGAVGDALRRADAETTGRPDEVTRRRHLRAALDAFDQQQTAGSSGADAPMAAASTAASETTIDVRDESAVVADVVAFNRPDRRRRPLGALLAAAAVVIVVGAVVPSVIDAGGDDATDTASVALDAAEDSADAGDAAFDDAAEESTAQASRAEAEAEVAEAEESAEAMSDEAADDAMEEAFEAEAAEEEVMEEAADLAEAGEATEGSPEAAGLAPIIPFDPEFRDETLEELLFRFEQGDPGREATCVPPEGSESLHVADGFAIADDTPLEMHLVALPDGGVELVVFEAEICEIR